MAVIIDMDMPKGCWNCKYMQAWDPDTDKCLLLNKEFDDRLDMLTSRLKDCPLKSADEMMAELKRYETLMFHEDGSPMGAFIHAQMVNEIVGRYCDKERKDG